MSYCYQIREHVCGTAETGRVYIVDRLRPHADAGHLEIEYRHMLSARTILHALALLVDECESEQAQVTTIYQGSVAGLLPGEARPALLAMYGKVMGLTLYGASPAEIGIANRSRKCGELANHE